MFGLRREQLADVLICMSTNKEFNDFQYRVTSAGGDFSGYNGEKAVVEFEVAHSGEIQQFRCFVKKMNFGFSEAAIYRSLNAVDAPIPRMVCAFNTSDSSEVVFLELLEQVGINSEDEVAFEDLLRTLAEFNALNNASVPSYQPEQLQEQANWLREAWEAAHGGRLGENLREVFASLPEHRHKLTAYFEEIRCTLSSRPQDVTHHDPANANVGYNKDGRLVLFDLHYVTAFPRFKDLALRLGASTSPMPDGRPVDDWIARYLESYNQLKDSAITVEECKQEIEALKQAQRLYFSAQCFDEVVAAFDNGDRPMQMGYEQWLTTNYQYIAELSPIAKEPSRH